MAERDNWAGKFDSSGHAVVPAMPSIQSTHDSMMRGEAPTPEVQRAFGVEPATSAAPVPAKRGVDGIMRQDWDKRRNEQGQFITKSEGQLRETWAKEGGYEANVQRVLATEQAILGLSENPQALQSAINELPKDIALKAADAMRLATSYREGGAIKFGMFIDSLSPSEYQTFETWWRKLSRGDQDAILAGISR